MTVKEIADELIALCRSGKEAEAIKNFYSEEIVSKEAMGPNPMTKGLEAIQHKTEWFKSSFELHSSVVNGPFINGDQFAVEFNYDVTEKATGSRHPMHEIALYTVSEGKIVEETFFYAA